MKKLSPQAWMAAAETQKVMTALEDARFVGGCVRNALANRKVADIDIATPLAPDDVIERLKRHKIKYAPTGLKHGTVTAIVEGHPFEITTLRRDVETFGRHAKVEFTDDWKEDAARRDFTINTIYSTLDGDLYDPFNGVEDLRLGKVHFVGDAAERIHEDVLRILRFFRFHAHFGKGDIDEEGLKACIAAAEKISILSAERVRHEILKLLEADACAAVWKTMLESGIVRHFLPEADDVRALENLVRLEEKYRIGAFPLHRLAVLLGKTDVKNIAQRLRLSNDQAEQLSGMADSTVSLEMKESDVRKLVYRRGNDMTRNLLLLAAAKAGDEGDLEKLYHEATSFRPPRFPVTGEDVMKLGIASGPEVGRRLSAVEDWWMEKDFKPNRVECLERLKNCK